MLKDFKEFAMRGSVVDMAVGIILGAAFGKVVTSMVADIAVFEFLIVAFAVYLVIRQINRLRKPAPLPPAPETKECPYCVSSIPVKATRCPQCTSELKTA